MNLHMFVRSEVTITEVQRSCEVIFEKVIGIFKIRLRFEANLFWDRSRSIKFKIKCTCLYIMHIQKVCALYTTWLIAKCKNLRSCLRGLNSMCSLVCVCLFVCFCFYFLFLVSFTNNVTFDFSGGCVSILTVAGLAILIYCILRRRRTKNVQLSVLYKKYAEKMKSNGKRQYCKYFNSLFLLVSDLRWKITQSAAELTHALFSLN